MNALRKYPTYDGADMSFETWSGVRACLSRDRGSDAGLPMDPETVTSFAAPVKLFKSSRA
jgi:hypothetical protein